MTKIKFFEKLDLVDSLIHSAGESNYDDAFNKISVYFNSPYICQYFFGQIKDKQWSEAVINSEFIKNYRTSQTLPLLNNQFDWLFMGYLLGVAEHAPELTSAYIKSITEIDDERLHQRMIEVMLRLPCNLSAELAISELEWCKTKSELVGLYPDSAGKLILHIQECNESLAFEFVRELLKVDSVTRETGKPSTSSNYRSVDINSRYSDWEYQAVLNKYISIFVLSSKNSFQYFADLLEQLSTVLRLEYSNQENDFSYIWRNTLEDNEQTRHKSGIKEHLLVCLRDISINLISNDNTLFQEIVHELNKYEWTIFKRLAIYISVKFPRIDLNLTEQLISNTDLYENADTRNEFSLLLDNAFDLVRKNVKDRVYEWIEDGADVEYYIERFIQHESTVPNEEQINDYQDYWKKTRLHLIRNHLEGKKLAEYKTLVEEKGEPDHPEYSSYTTSWVGPTSPLPANEISALDIEELVTKLKNWEPTGQHMASSPEGLSRELTEAIKTDINKYRHSAFLFIGLPPTYVRGFLQGFKDKITDLDHDSWSEIIKLSEWILAQEDNSEEEADTDFDEDPSWSWCRKTLAGLFRAGFKKGDGQIPIQLKEQIWPLLYTLTQDPDPTPEHEEQYGGSNMDPTTMSINTARGEAMHALVEYGLWFGRNTEDKDISFNDIPEMRKVLDDHLNPEIDPSLAIRSVYGQFYPWLNLLDSDWATKAKNEIFSEDNFGLGDAAWDAYISFCQPFDDTYRVISDIYLKYAKKLSDINEADDRDRSLEHIAEHIITYYWRSKLELDDELIQEFYKHAPLNLRKRTIDFIGRSLGNTAGGLEENIANRLKKLYEWRESQAQNANNYEELDGFCWWVDADIVDKEWVLTKFHHLLKSLDKVEDLDFAARKLGSYLEVNPLMVLECIDMMVDKLKIPGMYFTWDDSAQEILKEALLMDGAKEQAVELVHKFGENGFLKYRELLGTK